jgi:hypothetical protein
VVGFIGKLKNYFNSSKNGDAVSEAIVDIGGGENITAEHFEDAGSDSQPLDTDWLAILSIKRSGGGVAVGVVDPKNAKKAAPGEKRFYSRDSGGAEVASIWLKADGSVLIENESGSIELGSDGSFQAENDAGSFGLDVAGIFNVNNLLTIDTAGNLVTPGTITASNVLAGALSIGGVSLPSNHKHNYSWTDPAGSGTTSTPVS